MIVPPNSNFRRLVMSMAMAVIASLVPAMSRSAAAAETPAEARRKEVANAYRQEVAPFLRRYCVECHGKKRHADLNFLTMARKPESAAFRHQWQSVLAAMRDHAMPPEDAEMQPTDAERETFVKWVGMIKFLNPEDPGPFVIHRLTRAEYGNTLHDLFGVDPSVAADLPDEVVGQAYLNSLSPLQVEQYLGIANTVLDRALGPLEGPPTAMQQKLFSEPPSSGDVREAARNVARSLARSVYRRPATEAEIETLLKVFDLAQAGKLSYPASLRLVLKAMLVSPQFLFITPAKDVEAGKTIVPLDDHHLAARLSYFLWATMPDAELAGLADNGQLHEPDVLRSQVKRMLADRRARALFDGFGAQWLGVGALPEKTFDTTKFPQMTPAMRSAMYDEARLFFESIVRENQSVIHFVESPYTYLNGTLAPLYGLEKTITGPEMRRVMLADANRGGILAMPGVLAVTSFPERTSAVKRGVWVLEQVLGQHVPPAPANVPPLEKQDPDQVANLTLRQRTELHRTNAACANCHKTLDPIGFGLENFDAIGRWRDRDDTGGPIDAAGELPGGKRFSSPKELKAIIAGRKEEVARNLTEKLLAYALYRPLDGYDEIVVDRMMETLARHDYRMQAVITEIVTSYPFLNRNTPTPQATHAK